MMMSGRVTSACVALLFTLTSVSAVKKLNSIKDLKKLDFGQSVPEHSLQLLHWFANVVDIDTNNVIQLTFDPSDEDFGSHYYGNYERLLDRLPHGHQYYTVGNLNRSNAEQLPDYVRGENVWPNRGRIVFRVRELNTGRWAFQRIDRVYLTQHYEAHEEEGMYDPAHTYKISVHLLREIREFSVEGNQQTLSYLRNRFAGNISDVQLQDIRNTWGNLACLGLLLLIVIQEKYSIQHRHQVAGKNAQHKYVVNFPEARPQNNTDTSHCCTCLLLFLFVAVVVLIFLSSLVR
ncbi:uncharacterized protein LOC115046992 [Echeneis naucrates]|uniref:uncharacterized protein LOC115046992 n=1 Tax=Echeneis naucrates TaxID=173247 RepID=UPI00111365F7|nr:uncharacterized protein LOC115046992 [Echeneis naucrates]